MLGVAGGKTIFVRNQQGRTTGQGLGYIEFNAGTWVSTFYKALGHHMELGVLEMYHTKNNNGAKSISSCERLYSDSKSHLALKILQTRHGKILPPLAYELSVCSRLHNNTVFQEADDIRVLNGT